MELNRFYDQLLQFSLFQGLSRNELLQLAGNTKFGFQKVPAHKTVVREGDACNQLIFLISGQLDVTTWSDDHSYHVVERLHAPWLLQPEVLFGAQPRYTASFKAETEAHFITLSKDEVLRLLDDFLIFRINLLNTMSTLSQRSGHLPWRRSPQTLRHRIIRFLLDHSTYPAGRKEFFILMRQLAAELNEQRLNVSQVLNDMQADGLIVLHRGRIEVPSLEQLLM